MSKRKKLKRLRRLALVQERTKKPKVNPLLSCTESEMDDPVGRRWYPRFRVGERVRIKPSAFERLGIHDPGPYEIGAVFANVTPPYSLIGVRGEVYDEELEYVHITTTWVPSPKRFDFLSDIGTKL